MVFFFLLFTAFLHVVDVQSTFAAETVWVHADWASNKIIEVDTTLQLSEGINPSHKDGWATLWPGLLTESGDFVQTLAVNQLDPNGNFAPTCRGHIDIQHQWCLVPFTWEKLEGCPAPQNDTQCPKKWDTQTPVGLNKAVNIRYVVDTGTNHLTQTVSLDGNTVGTLVTNSGPGKFLDFAVECGGCEPLTVPVHSWVNTKVVLDHPDNDFEQWINCQDGATCGGINSPDQGKTWIIGWIHMPEVVFTKTNARDRSLPKISVAGGRIGTK